MPDKMNPYVISKLIKKDIAYFTLRWSPLAQADRHKIREKVPALSGIYELYYKNDTGRFVLYHFGKAWYGGLRHKIREHIDEDWPDNKRYLDILRNHDVYYRYSQTDSFKDMQDIFFFFSKDLESHMNADEKPPGVEDSGRYSRIYMKEVPDDVRFA